MNTASGRDLRPLHGSQKAAMERRILNSCDRFWKPSALRGSRSAVQHLMTDLVRRGELRHVRKGLYWRGTKTPLGMSPPSPVQLATELVGTKGVGPAGLSASNALRLSTQVPRKAQVAVPNRAPTDSGPVAFVSRAARHGRAQESLNAQEVALLEVLDGWDKVIELPLPDAWAQLLRVMSGDGLRLDKLVRAAKTEPGQVRTRLRRLLRESTRGNLYQQVPPADVRHEKALDAALAGML